MLNPILRGAQEKAKANVLQEKQEKMSREQLEMLQKISTQMDAVITLLKDCRK